jgi:glutathione peroxidase
MKMLIILMSFLIVNNGHSKEDFSIHNYSIKSHKGKEIKFSQFKGKPLLIVNIATHCGYTRQLNGLEKLYKSYKKKGLVVIGIPSNDFGSQTPENDLEVGKFCRTKYGVTFPISIKVPVTGSSAPEFMKKATTFNGGSPIAWNFEKFLFDKQGRLFKRFDSATKPNSIILKRAIEHLK